MGSSRGLGAVIARRLARGGGSTAEAFGDDVTHERQVAELAAAITGRSARLMCWCSTPPARGSLR
jgi:hypothetical protein